MLAQASLTADPFRFVWHPEVWLLVGFLTGAYVYMVRVIGPHAVPFGQPPVSRRQGRLLRRRDVAALGGERLADPRPR